MSKVSNNMWGFIFIILGVILGLNALEITNINIFFNGWWTLFIIIPCFIGLFKNNEDKTGSLIGLIIGVCLLFACLGIITYELIWKLMIPFILIAIGISFFFKPNFKDKIKEFDKIKENEYCATFGEQIINFNNKKFEGCSLNAIFGSVECDLRDAKIEKDTLIEINAIFGSVTLYIDDDIEIKINATPIFGSISNHKNNKKKDTKKTIYIKATAMFGGVDIK